MKPLRFSILHTRTSVEPFHGLEQAILHKTLYTNIYIYKYIYGIKCRLCYATYSPCSSIPLRQIPCNHAVVFIFQITNTLQYRLTLLFAYDILQKNAYVRPVRKITNRFKMYTQQILNVRDITMTDFTHTHPHAFPKHNKEFIYFLMLPLNYIYFI